jgi:hypothetical protein
MRRLAWAAVILVLVGCAPSLVPSLSRSGDDVVVTVSAARDVFDVQLVILSAVTGDARCSAFAGDLVCVLGDFSARKVESVLVQGDVDEVFCVAYGFVSENRSLTSYRSFACAVH